MMTDHDMPARPQRHRLPVSLRAVRRLLPLARCGFPASGLADASVAGWVRAHRITVYADGTGQLALAGRRGIRPEQLVLRCGPDTGPILGALNAGVSRFVVSCEEHVEVLTARGHQGTRVHVDDACPAVLGHGCLDVIGLHGHVQASCPPDWGAAAERLLGRIALMRTGGAALTRISLSGGPMASWIDGDTCELKAIASAVDEAIDEGCARWRLPRPAVTFAPSAA